MTMKMKGAPGNVFNAFGKMGLLVKQMRGYQNAQLTNMTDTTNGLVAQFVNESDIQGIVGSEYIDSINAASDAGTLAQNVAAAAINRFVFRDNPLLNQTLQNTETLTSLEELIRQMKTAQSGDTVLAMTITATPSGFIGKGNGIVVTSVRRPLDGLVLENAFAETMTITCTSDSFQSSVAAGNEGFTVRGAGQQSNLFAFNWPLGSNAQTTLSAINGNKDNSQGNLLTNSGFASWTGKKTTTVGSLLDNWTIDTGLPLISQETGLVYGGGSALKITGDGTTNLQMRQQFGSSTGTLGTLKPQNQYSFNIFARRDAIAPGAGTLVVDLVDQNNTAIQDANGANQTFTVDLTTLTTGYSAFNVAFRTPEVFPPSSYFLRIRTTVPLTNNRSVYLDTGALGKMTQAYTSGPFLSVHSGSIPFTQGGVLGDFATIVVTNSRGAGGTLDTFQTLFARLFPNAMIGNELLLPSSAAPTISDTLIG